MIKRIVFFVLIFSFISCQKPFDFNEEEQYKLINENLYNDFLKKENKKIVLNEFKLKEPELELLDFDYEKEKRIIENEMATDGVEEIPNMPLPPLPPNPITIFSNEKWKQKKLKNFIVVTKKDSLTKDRKYFFAISKPIYNSKIKIALIKLERYRIDGGWTCIPYEIFFLFERKNNTWVSLEKEGSDFPYYTLLNHFQKKEHK